MAGVTLYCHLDGFLFYSHTSEKYIFMRKRLWRSCSYTLTGFQLSRGVKKKTFNLWMFTVKKRPFLLVFKLSGHPETCSWKPHPWDKMSCEISPLISSPRSFSLRCVARGSLPPCPHQKTHFKPLFSIRHLNTRFMAGYDSLSSLAYRGCLSNGFPCMRDIPVYARVHPSRSSPGLSNEGHIFRSYSAAPLSLSRYLALYFAVSLLKSLIG